MRLKVKLNKKVAASVAAAKALVSATVAVEALTALNTPLTFSLEELGQGNDFSSKSAIDCRIKALQRLRDFSPPLPLYFDLQWDLLCRSCAIGFGKSRKSAIGNAFRGFVVVVIDKLGLHYKGPKSSGKVFTEASSDAAAFATFVHGLVAWAPQGSNALLM